MVQGSGLGQLNEHDWRRLQETADRFEKAWREDQATDLATFLPPPADGLRRLALHELIKIDLEMQARRKRVVLLDSYVKRFPELGLLTSLPPALIYEEYRVRRRYGDRPSLDLYRERFPAQFADLQRLVDEPRTLGTATPSISADPLARSVPDLPPAPPAAPARSSTSEQLIPGGQGYLKRDYLGGGMFSDVWRGAAPGGCPVAIKIIRRPIDHQEVQGELKALELIKELGHPFLAKIDAFWIVDGRMHVAMELAEGTLRQRLKECKAAGLPGVPVDELLTYIRESAEAIDYLHSENVIHRDIKPENILLLKGHAKVADLGLARELEDKVHASVTGVGTPRYMAPEVWHRHVNRHSDQYSLAMTYVELRLGRPAFDSRDLAGAMLDAIQGQPNLEGLPAPEQRVLRKALAKDPERRYPNCRAWVQALEEAVHPKQEQPPWSKWWYAAAALALIAAAAAVLIFLPTNGPTRFTLDVPQDISLAAGGDPVAVRVQVQRTEGRGAIRLTFADTPAGIHIPDEAIIEEGADAATVNVSAARGASLGQFALTIHASASDQEEQIPLALAVRPWYWQNGWQPVDSLGLVRDKKGRSHYRAITVIKGNSHVRFLAVPYNGGAQDPETFYIMENKVWTGLFGEYARQHPEARPALESVASNQQDPNPVMGIPVAMAVDFAHWLGGNMGKLPSVRQWDKAAGAYEAKPGDGPFIVWGPAPLGALSPHSLPMPIGLPVAEFWRSIDSWRLGGVAVDRPDESDDGAGRGSRKLGPLPVGTAYCDISPYGCRDMAGNGWEWSGELDDGRLIPFPPPKSPAHATVAERSYSFKLSRPLRFEESVAKAAGQSSSQPYNEPADDIGFRVILDPSHPQDGR